MRKLTTGLVAAVLVTALAVPAAQAQPAVDAVDDLVSDQLYVRHDGGTDAAIELCNSQDPADFGNNIQNNEPFSVVSPTNPDLIVAGWNDYCSDWMGLGVLDRRRRDLDELARPRLSAGHLGRGHAVAGVHPDEHRE